MTHEHEQYEDLLSAYLDGELADRAELETHLATCPSCAARLAEYRAMGDSLRRQAREEPGLPWRAHGRAGAARCGVRESWPPRPPSFSRSGLPSADDGPLILRVKKFLIATFDR
jgi:anti-sigma factor RsiW